MRNEFEAFELFREIVNHVEAFIIEDSFVSFPTYDMEENNTMVLWMNHDDPITFNIESFMKAYKNNNHIFITDTKGEEYDLVPLCTFFNTAELSILC